MSEAILSGAPAAPLGELSLLAERVRDFTVAISDPDGRGSGSGVLWDAEGTVISNAHVVRGTEARVQFRDGRSLAARVVARDRFRDLVALRTEVRTPTPAVAGEPDRLRPGELVFAMGNPHGAPGAFTWGVVHALHRHGATGVLRWVRADLALAPGNSGGPLVDAEGRVVGINARVEGGTGLAIPTPAVLAFLERRGEGRPLGLRVRPVRLVGLRGSAAGLLVLSVDHGSPAAVAGLGAGDVVVGVGGEAVREFGELRVLAGEAAPGSRIPLEVARGGGRVALALRVPAPPAATAA